MHVSEDQRKNLSIVSGAKPPALLVRLGNGRPPPEMRAHAFQDLHAPQKLKPLFCVQGDVRTRFAGRLTWNPQDGGGKGSVLAKFRKYLG
jgi:hypothetical protein